MITPKYIQKWMEQHKQLGPRYNIVGGLDVFALCKAYLDAVEKLKEQNEYGQF